MFDGLKFSKTLPEKPGVYRMFDKDGSLLYVGKAKNLYNRVSSYFSKNHTDNRISTMVSQIDRIEIVVVLTEVDALILESRLIKSENPKYNIALRDDKGYPYIHLSTEDEYPKLRVHYGKKREKGKYFGPFPSYDSVKQITELFQKQFKLRTCSDNFFKNRSRPCLEYQINRCSGPCAKKITLEKYNQNVEEIIKILDGSSDQLLKQMLEKMSEESKLMNFEIAAYWRDKINALRKIQAKISVDSLEGNYDFVGIKSFKNISCISLIHIRNGNVVGSKTHKIEQPFLLNDEDVVENFILNYIQNPNFPISTNIVIPKINEFENLKKAVFELSKSTLIEFNKQKELIDFEKIAQSTAEATLETYKSNEQLQEKRFKALINLLNLEKKPERIECFDISHTQGTDTVASCVVAGQKGAIKSAYRKYNIENITGGDDYAAMKQVLTRRFSKKENLPDILLIDGGIGQVSIAMEVLNDLDLDIYTLGISKGPERKAGEEKLIIGQTGEEIIPGADNLALHLLQTIRDEAHRFAIEGHRKRRNKRMVRSTLEDIEGIGQSKKKALIAYFGSFNNVKNATEEELSKVPGIGKKLAKIIHDQLKK